MVMKRPKRIVTLMYHGLDSDDEPSELIKKGELVYVVGIEDFKKQMEYLVEGKIPIVTLQDCYTKENFAEENYAVSVILTFDDGNETNYTKAFPILKQNGFKAYFFITTDWIGQRYSMTEVMIRDLHNAGMMIGSHGKTHKFFSDLSDREIDFELRASKERLEEITMDRVTCLSLPGGRGNDRIFNLAKKNGYSLIFNSVPTINQFADFSKPIGRFAIKRNLALHDLSMIVSGNLPVFPILKYKTLAFAKSLFGNLTYQKIREIVMRNGA